MTASVPTSTAGVPSATKTTPATGVAAATEMRTPTAAEVTAPTSPEVRSAAPIPRVASAAAEV